MKKLNEHIKESLLSNFDDLEASIDPIKEIKQFIKDNYLIIGGSRLLISNEPNENGKYTVSCSYISVKNYDITSLTNGMFEWDSVRNFSCANCDSLTTLEGAPKRTRGYFSCRKCNSLTSLEGAPKEVIGSFNCSYCNSLTSIEGAPKKVGGSFNCIGCNSLTSLEGSPEKVGEKFDCSYCKSLTSLKGSPKKVGGDFVCLGCQSLKSLKDTPKEVGGGIITRWV